LTKTSGQADVLKVLRLEAALTCSLSPTLQIPKHNLCNRITIELIKAHQIEEVKPNCTFQERADLEIPTQSHFIPVTDCVMAVYSGELHIPVYKVMNAKKRATTANIDIHVPTHWSKKLVTDGGLSCFTFYNPIQIDKRHGHNSQQDQASNICEVCFAQCLSPYGPSESW